MHLGGVRDGWGVSSGVDLGGVDGRIQVDEVGQGLRDGVGLRGVGKG